MRAIGSSELYVQFLDRFQAPCKHAAAGQAAAAHRSRPGRSGRSSRRCAIGGRVSMEVPMRAQLPPCRPPVRPALAPGAPGLTRAPRSGTSSSYGRHHQGQRTTRPSGALPVEQRAAAAAGGVSFASVCCWPWPPRPAWAPHPAIHPLNAAETYICNHLQL